MNKKNYTYIAVDVSKETLYVHSCERSHEVSYDRKGLNKILKEAAQTDNALVVLEATGGYEQKLLEALHDAAIACKLVNPSLVRAFANSEGIKAKTDKIDARMIFRFACSKQLEPMNVPDAQEQKLAALVKRRGQLSKMLSKEKTRLQNSPKCIHADIRGVIRYLEGKMARLEKKIQQLITSSEKLRQRSQVIESVPGVGPVTARMILALLPEITHVSRNQLTALAGLAPFNRDSGKTEGKRCIHGGRAQVRPPLYMAAVAASRCNPVIRDYVARLRDRGKPFKCAIVAAMRKLLLHIQSLLRKLEQMPLNPVAVSPAPLQGASLISSTTPRPPSPLAKLGAQSTGATIQRPSGPEPA